MQDSVPKLQWIRLHTVRKSQTTLVDSTLQSSAKESQQIAIQCNMLTCDLKSEKTNLRK